MPDDREDLEQRLAHLEKDVERLSGEMIRNSEAHREFYNRFGSIETQHISLQKDVTNMCEKINEMYIDLKTLMNVPNKRYETIITAIVTAVIGIAIGYILK